MQHRPWACEIRRSRLLTVESLIQECGSSTLNAKSNSTTLHIPSVMCWRATVHVSSAWDKALFYYTSTECQQLFAPTVSVSSTDLWRTCGLRSRKHGNLQTPGQGQQQNPLNQVNLNTNSPSVLPQHGQQKQSAAFHCRLRTLHFLHLPLFFPSVPLSLLLSFIPPLSSTPPSFLLFFLPRVQWAVVPPPAAATCPSKKRAVDSNGRCLMRLPWVGICRHAQLSRSVRLSLCMSARSRDGQQEVPLAS